MRRKYYPGEAVVEGIYWKNKAWEFIAITEGGALPTEEGVAYYWVPRVLVLLAGPLLGLVYVLALPFAGLLFLAYLGLRSAIRGLASIWWRDAERGTGSRR